jgi:arsenate reductase
MAKPKNFLFICRGNEARSQMAEGFARSMAGGNVKVYSAGVDPHGIDSHAIHVMEEVGIDISKQEALAFDGVPVSKIDTVVTLSSDSDPLPKNLRKKTTQIHWPLTDPAATSGSDAEVKKAFRSVRDEIRNRVEVLLVG